MSKKIAITLTGWFFAIIMFFPIFWMLIISFKTEIEAIGNPSLTFKPTLENYIEVNQRADYFKYALNSVFESFGATILSLIIAIPAAYSVAFFPTKNTKNILLWMLSTKMLPAVGVLVPIYLISRDLGLLDTRTLLIIIFSLSNLPIIVLMLYSFFKEVPFEILEAAKMDGATTFQQIYYLLLPLALPGIASTSLLSIILCWNEAFWSINLTTQNASSLTALIASFSAPEGLFWARLSAVSTLAIAPILIFGWITQKQLVRGLTFGAVK